MNRLLIRNEVKTLIREDTYPVDALNAAINRVIRSINLMGRFTFHELNTTLSLSNGVQSYAMGQSTIAEELLVYALGIEGKQKPLQKYNSHRTAIIEQANIGSADGPTHYSLWGRYVYVYPTPNATAAVYPITILGYQDIPDLQSDLEVPGIPETYHSTVIAFNAAAQIRPNLAMPEGLTIAQLAREYTDKMISREAYKPLVGHQVRLDDRFRGFENKGQIR